VRLGAAGIGLNLSLFRFRTGYDAGNFHKIGTSPEDKDVLNSDVTGSASSYANSFKIRDGILSGPIALLA
jgi:hypothetical protein